VCDKSSHVNKCKSNSGSFLFHKDFIEGVGLQDAGGGPLMAELNKTISRPKNADKATAKE